MRVFGEVSYLLGGFASERYLGGMGKDTDARAVSCAGLLGLGGLAVGVAIAVPVGLATGAMMKWLLLIVPIGVGIGLAVGAIVAVCCWCGCGWCPGCGKSVADPDVHKCPNCGGHLMGPEESEHTQ